MTKGVHPVWVKLATAVSLVTFLSAGYAQALVIDFEDFPEGTVLDDQYLGLGVDFNATATVAEAGLGLPGVFPPFSGTHVVFNSASFIAASAIGGTWSFAGGYITGISVIHMAAFASDLSLLGVVSTPAANFIGAGTGVAPNYFLSISAPDIAFILFTDSGNSFVLDDFTYIASIPEPSMFALLSGGLLAFALYRRAR